MSCKSSLLTFLLLNIIINLGKVYQGSFGYLNCLQISIYAWMLEQEGYVVRDLRFTHINKPYPVSYMKYEIENMFFPNGEHYMNLL